MTIRQKNENARRSRIKTRPRRWKNEDENGIQG